MPKLREALMKKFQGVCALLPLVQIERTDIYTGSLKNYDMDGEEILSQNTIYSNENNDVDMEEDEEELMDSEDSLDLSGENSQTHHESFRSRSTIV